MHGIREITKNVNETEMQLTITCDLPLFDCIMVKYKKVEENWHIKSAAYYKGKEQVTLIEKGEGLRIIDRWVERLHQTEEE